MLLLFVEKKGGRKNRDVKDLNDAAKALRLRAGLWHSSNIDIDRKWSQFFVVHTHLDFIHY